jgi:hypothetical protein
MHGTVLANYYPKIAENIFFVKNGSNISTFGGVILLSPAGAHPVISDGLLFESRLSIKKIPVRILL